MSDPAPLDLSPPIDPGPAEPPPSVGGRSRVSAGGHAVDIAAGSADEAAATYRRWAGVPATSAVAAAPLPT